MATFAQKRMDLKAAWENRDIALLQGLLHKLAGSSGSYGFNNINLLCHEIMELLENNIVNNDKQIDDCLKKVAVLLGEA